MVKETSSRRGDGLGGSGRKFDRKHRPSDKDDTKGKPSYPAKRFKKSARTKTRGSRTKEGKEKRTKEKGKMTTFPFTSFQECWDNNFFCTDSLSAINCVGLDIDSALNVVNLQCAGRISQCFEAWDKITNDKWVLSVVKDSYRLQFVKVPRTPWRRGNPPTDLAGQSVLDNEVESMLVKGATRKVESQDHEVVSPFFARPKKTPGKWRPIVSLKYVNKHLRYNKFRMTGVAQIRPWIRKDYYFVSIDLKDAYFSVGLHPSAWRYTRFNWKNTLYEFKCILFGLALAPRTFTKVVEAVLLFLRKAFKMLIMGYIDDFLMQVKGYATALLQAKIALLVLYILGFEVNFEKSSLIPQQCTEHLGFVWNSIEMTISLPVEKIEKIVKIASDFLKLNCCTARELRSFVGRLESIRPVTAQAPLHYRSLQQVLRRQKPWHGGK